MSDASYLSDPSFLEPHRGPQIVDDLAPRDPSLLQIRRMCEAIRQHVPRDPVGAAQGRVTVMVVDDAEFNVLSRDEFI